MLYLWVLSAVQDVGALSPMLPSPPASGSCRRSAVPPLPVGPVGRSILRERPGRLRGLTRGESGRAAAPHSPLHVYVLALRSGRYRRTPQGRSRGVQKSRTGPQQTLSVHKDLYGGNDPQKAVQKGPSDEAVLHP